MAAGFGLVPRLLLFLFVSVLLAFSAHAEKRVALVIGNSAYRHAAPLANPKNDAADMAAKLQSLGFDVVSGLDLDLAGMRSTVRDFISRLEGADMALFFYAGHGLQVNGENYMAPTDAKLSSYDFLDFEALPINLVMSAMERNTRINLVFLDACRDNPLAENLARSMGTRSGSVGRGLAKLGSGVGSLIAFATQPGNVALDGSGRNSPFTTALIKHLGTPGQDVTRDLVLVRRDVLEATGGKQVPWDNSSLTGEVVLMPKAEEPKPQAPAAVAAPTDNSVELAYWGTIRDSTEKGYFEAYLQRWPQGTFADLARLKIASLDRAAASVPEVKDAKPDGGAELAYWDSIKSAGSVAYFEAYLARWPKGLFAEIAAIRIDELKTAQAARAEQSRQPAAAPEKPVDMARLAEPETRALVVETEPAPADPVELARAIQNELNRVGCSVGRVDGEWGRGSERALKDYAGRQGIRLASTDPSAEILDRLKATTVRVCPLVCGKGQEERNGRCERVKREAKLDATPSTAERPKEEKPRTGGGEACYATIVRGLQVSTKCFPANSPEIRAHLNSGACVQTGGGGKYCKRVK